MNETDTTETDMIGTDTKGAGDRPRLIRRHDQFAKQLLDQKGLADVFLRERLPAALTARLTPEPASDRSESFVDATLAERRGDRVYSLALADGPQVLVWTMIEHKSAPDPAAFYKPWVMSPASPPVPPHASRCPMAASA
jgi:hypothetical protein